MREIIAIFDYEGGRIIVRDVSAGTEEAAELIAKEEGVDLSDCEWMGGALTLDIQ
jgi:hypothetical protein